MLPDADALRVPPFTRRRFLEVSCAGLPALLSGVSGAIGGETKIPIGKAKSLFHLPFHPFLFAAAGPDEQESG